ncbi:FAD/NAD(P)-binding protein [Herbiconiux flava]|uniref:Putative NAD(P)/FAD-binding protein YdhS n=1 Tax=Herbiconiux flava TaxID=881268 RepID=A0A852STC7_9MICO|nr:FAD/NAD(P)-binding protein [Herbiconiux flava]NYD72107.1 putative NAD(P)/FAD-binding protein YdhS [Herbiconiux flava]GLK17929.1 adenylate cyclase [Herbiconiux flava]
MSARIPAPSRPAAPVSLAVVGAGPRGVGVLERLAANLDELWGPDRRTRDGGPSLVVHLIDPHPAGPGRIWRHDQSPLLKLNSMAADVTMFTDETSTIDGPVRPGPSLIEWAERVRGGSIRVPEDRLDDALRAELRHLGPASFPTRRLQSLYLRWFYEEALDALGPGVQVREHRSRASAVTELPDGRRRVGLERGRALTVDLVLYSLGHTGADPQPEHARLIDFARRRELYYLPPAFTADADTRAIVPGQRVIVRGFGLAAVDLIVLLTEGRGGRFTTDAGRLRYEPSGREPRILIGSRRGVPYHSKIGSTLAGEAPAGRFFTPAIAAGLAASRATLDFAADVWPLIAQEMLWGYYRELVTGHPERVRIGWPEFAARFEALDPRASIVATATATDATAPVGGTRGRGFADPVFADAADEERVRRDAAELTALIERTVIDELDRLFLPQLDRPLDGVRDDGPDGAEALQHRVREYIERDLRLRTLPEHSATLGLFIALLTSLFALAEIVSSPTWTARSRVEDINGWWLGWFSFIASGPPAHRLEELLALSEAGVVRFLGAGLRVEADEEGGVFRASSENHAEVVTASALVDARLPDTSVARSDNALLRALLDAGAAVEEVAHDPAYRAPTGRLAVRPDDRRVLQADEPSGRSYAIGPYTNSPFVGAFSRPRTNAVAFRENDRVARALLQHLAELADTPATTQTPPPPDASGSPPLPPGAFTDRLWGEFAAQPR